MKHFLAAAALLVVLPGAPGQASESPDNSGLIVREVMERLGSYTDAWFHAGTYERSIHALRMYKEYDPNYLPAYFLSAWLLWSTGQDEAAQQTFSEAVLAAPDSYEPYLEAGTHWMGRRDYVRASLWLAQACIHGAPAQGWKSLSHAYRYLGQYDEALSAMERAAELDPEDSAIPPNLQRLRDLAAGVDAADLE